MTDSDSLHVTAAIGMARYLGSPDEDRLALDLGDYHPGNHGGLEIDLDIDASLSSGLMPLITTYRPSP